MDYVTKNKDKEQLWFLDYKYIIMFMILFSLIDKQLSLLLIAGVVYFKIKKWITLYDIVINLLIKLSTIIVSSAFMQVIP